MSCWDTVADYGLRAIGIGLRGLPKTDFTLCQQVTLIGSGMIWNVYFGAISLFFGFFFAVSLALGKFSDRWWLRLPACDNLRWKCY